MIVWFYYTFERNFRPLAAPVEEIWKYVLLSRHGLVWQRPKNWWWQYLTFCWVWFCLHLDPLVSWNVERRRVQHCRCVENWCFLQIESSSFYKLGVQQNGVQHKEKTDLVGRCNINREQKLKFSCVLRKSFYSFPFSAVGIKGRRIKGTYLQKLPLITLHSKPPFPPDLQPCGF